MSLPEKPQVCVFVRVSILECVRKSVSVRACANVCFLEMCFNLVRTPNR